MELLTRTYPRGGYYVEAGAHDGVGDSQTKFLEDTGLWQGLCVEPSRAYYGLQISRTCKTDNRCLWSYDGVVDYVEIAGNQVELSGIPQCFRDRWDRSQYRSATRAHPCCTLTTLLRDHETPAHIEFLCLDTEGSELNILRSHNWKAYTFGAILVEHNRMEATQRALLDLLTGHGYRRHSSVEADDLYLKGSI
jgi:hypothetical protein